MIKKYKLRDKGVKGGGYDLTPNTQKLLAAGQIDFTIDQQPYLQGFLPILQLYLYQASGTLTGMADVNTGLKFLDKETVVPYNSTKSRYEGTSIVGRCDQELSQWPSRPAANLRPPRPPTRARRPAGPSPPAPGRCSSAS